ncbi:hypothetical protein Ana3638_05180 [Anaerocolumna sedimenticola]|uniref:Putative Flagellin Flp1-like domain-containing protein n=1 Tax=Anaerocolumna sedimenticola TaxID=2696063 RepID=A0A6P1TK11_9FIRM|nr:Flp1 family type IVb pilin [Anaerocolumna sedimenticola]QHQ60246.1 hypothetical protein Ana3638_05180 [Anaerocolumna sedimenticola]
MNKIKEFINEEDGIAIVEIILILVLLIGLVVIFRDKIVDLTEKIINSITADMNNINPES